MLLSLRSLTLSVSFGLYFFLLIGCRSVSGLADFETVLFAEGRPSTTEAVGSVAPRQFDFYFLEGNRLKMLGDNGAAALSYMEALKLDSTCAVCYFEVGNLLIRNGEFVDAEKFIFEAVRFSPDNPHYLSLLSRLYFHQEKNELALQSVRYLNRLHPGQPDYLFQQAEIESEMNRYDDVLHTFSTLEKIIGIQEFLSLEKHMVLRQNGDNKAARKELERLIEHYPSESNYLLYLADFYLEMGKSDQAYSLYQEVARDYPSNGQVHFSLANYYFSLGQADNFKSSIFKAFSHPNTPFELKMQRVLPFLMGIEEEDPALTVEDLRSVISGLREMHPFDLQAHILAANFYKHINDNAAAREALQTALYIDENNQEVWQDYLILLFEEETQNQFLSESLRASSLFPDNGLFHYFAGYGFLFQEKRKEALVSFETALPFLSDNASLQAQVYGLMGDLYFQEQQAQKAFRAYEESLKLEQENVVVLNNYAYYLSELDLHLDKAERMISRVIELEGSNPTYLDTYAWVLFKRGQYLDALYFIEQAVANMEEESAVLYEHYGDILFKVGNIEKALEKWNKALELGSDVSSVLEDKIAEQKYLPEIMDYE